MSRLSAMSSRLPDLRLPVPALVGLAVVILLLLGVSVVALRSEAADPTANAAGTEPAVGDAAAGGSAADAQDPASIGGRAAVEGASPDPAAGASAEDQPAEDAAGGDSPGPDPPPAAGDVALPPGTCINDDGRAANAAGVAVIDCATAHTGEVHAATTVTGGPGAPYPGQSVLQADSQAFCQGQTFEDYIGRSYAESRLFVYWLVPTAESWAAGDRDVACIFYDSRGLMTGSQRGTRQ